MLMLVSDLKGPYYFIPVLYFYDEELDYDLSIINGIVSDGDINIYCSGNCSDKGQWSC